MSVQQWSETVVLGELGDDPQFKSEGSFVARFTGLCKPRGLPRGGGEVAISQAASSPFA